MKKDIFNIEKYVCTTLILLVVLYFSQGVLLPEGELIGQVILVLILGISFFYLLKSIYKKILTSLLEKVWLLFLTANILFFIFHSDPYIGMNFGSFKTVLLNFLPFFPFLFFAKKNILKRKHLILFLILILPIFIYDFIFTFHTYQLETMKDDFVLNTIYLLIGLFPFVFFFKKKSFVAIGLIIIWFFIIQSNKRAAILVGLIAIGVLFYQVLFITEKKQKLYTYGFSLLLFIGLIYSAYVWYQENDFLQQRMLSILERDSSGRDNLFINHFNTWYNSNNANVYFWGLGFNSSQIINQGLVAHNDWIDMLGSFGIFGISLYLFLWYSMIRELYIGNWDKYNKSIMILFLGISFIASMFFRWYNSPFPYMNFLILPYLINNKNNLIRA